MCPKREFVAEKCDRLEGLLHALRMVTIAREEDRPTDDAYVASLFLIKEVENDLAKFKASLKACACQSLELKEQVG